MNRREFIKKTFTLGMATGVSFILPGKRLFASSSDTATPDLVAVMGGEPGAMFDSAIAAMGGMSRYVKPGQTVVVKPNIGWNRTPDLAANTNPLLVKRIIEQCLGAKAKKVYVFDNTCDVWEWAYKTSGIEEIAKAANATVVPGNASQYYQDVSIQKAQVLTTAKVHEVYLESDVVINVPVLKHHASSRMTCSMKNLMGVVYDRGFYHSRGLHSCIAEFCLSRKPDLNVVDAYTVTLRRGPQQATREDLALMKALIISPDIVAADTAALRFFNQGVETRLKNDPDFRASTYDLDDVRYISIAEQYGIGTTQLDKLNIKRIAL